MKTFVRAAIGGCCAAAAWSTSAAVTTYDPVSGLVTIPSVRVGADTYTGVRLQRQGSFVFSLAGATLGQPGSPAVGTFDAASGVLSLPAVRVGGDTYLDVTLRHQGDYVFSLAGASALPADLRSDVDAYLADYDALWASRVPETGEQRVSTYDACWRDRGRSRLTYLDDWNGQHTFHDSSERHQVGRRSTNPQVVAVRNRINPDGSGRTEVDVEHDIEYRDGSTAYGERRTLIRGSSYGTSRCPSAQAAARLRELGDQRLVETGVRQRAIREERYTIADGTAQSPLVRYVRSHQWHIADPENNATYVIVSGPGPSATVGGSAVPFSLIFLAPRLIAGAPEMQGRNGNFVNMRTDEPFRFCGGGSIPVASIADCVGQGAVSNAFGFGTSTPNAAADATFQSAGFVPGGWYRYDVYDNDGWKTVNGHSGRPPIATYWEQLRSSGFSFVDVAGSGPDADAFPRLGFVGRSLVQVRDNVLAPAPTPENVRWNPWFRGIGDQVRIERGTETHVGPRVGNAAGVAYPGYRSINDTFPAPLAEGHPAWIVTPAVPGQGGKTYHDFTLTLSDRNGRYLISTLLFQ